MERGVSKKRYATLEAKLYHREQQRKHRLRRRLGLGKLRGGYPKIAPEIRFWKFVNRTETCWLWTGCKNRYGYGKFNAGAKTRPNIRAHRYAYEIFIGKIPDGLTIDHLCRNTSCVNPVHLEAVTVSENVRRREEAKN